MKVSIIAFVAGLIGAIGVLLFLIAFGTDYWLLATENCEAYDHESESKTSRPRATTEEASETHDESSITFHHEGFFWRCWFSEDISHDSIWNFWFTNQPPSKFCVRGYLFPLPIALGPLLSHDNTAVYRGFWTVFIILAVTAAIVGGFLLVCAVPFVSAKLYKVGGGFLLAAGTLFSILIFLFVMWKEFAADLEKYILSERSGSCKDVLVYVQYGWSFMFAAVGIPLVLLSGLLFYVIGRTIEAHNK
ncbi:transmembrane protein 182 [Callorhinchus milii]|uniref:Transmembrane protein 182-like n=1 Tax=Callorhinchus milii TaxID=7868 RepID=V9KUH2_CALMI|nr:transmembrane protein 182 [Callorhinchus milii]|eukprot:gi/632935483/ref/XP_007890258.1/ PREDICTED: transmembrane protein 182-like [Callorhinchus milii]